mmetsp:Transcript_17920/g.22852  ORF Transcript_17920/g.22852 Transcript_17920/m.22852 type:complete len:227 (-) Transcript_17920:1111-1791(-)
MDWILEKVHDSVDSLAFPLEVFDSFASGMFSGFVTSVGPKHDWMKQFFLLMDEGLKLGRKGAKEPWLSVSVVLFFLICNLMLQSVSKFGGLSQDIIPDLQFGFSSSKLMNMLEKMGRGGRFTYLFVGLIDIFLYIPSYTLLYVLSIAYTYPEHNQYGPALLLSGLVAMDLVETPLCIVFSLLYPIALPSPIVFLASSANMIKWILVGIVSVLILCHLVVKLFQSRR